MKGLSKNPFNAYHIAMIRTRMVARNVKRGFEDVYMVVSFAEAHTSHLFPKAPSISC